MNPRKRFLPLLFLTMAWLCPAVAFSQASLADSAISMGLVYVNYNGAWTGADMAKRFGFTHQLGLEAGYKHKSNFYVLGGFNFLFGGKVKERDMLDAYSFLHKWPASNGTTFYDYGFIADDGSTFLPRFYQQGFTTTVRIGKILPKFRIGKGTNPNCGPFVELGGQFIEHRIRIQPVSRHAEYLSAERLKGYDRLTNGFGTMQSIGYRFFGNSRFVSFMVALDMSENFTRGRRPLNWDTNTVDNKPRLDLLYGFRVGWALPLYRTAPDKYYYY